MTLRALLLSSLILCTGCPTDGGGGSGDDDDDTTPELPQPAPLAETSDGECPNTSASGISTFSSDGLDRKVAVLFPDGDTTDLPIVFFFHGLTTPDQNPVENTVNGLNLQGLADSLPAIVIAPESRAVQMPLVGEVSLWGILGDPDPDLVLFDDLRACAVNELGGDIRRVNAMGFSGGALWTTQILMSRSDTLASAVEFSGGAELDVPMDGGPFLLYSSPAEQTPVLMTSGGAQDVWPQGFAIIDFNATTDTLQGGLRVDGHYAVRCTHEQGHTVTNADWSFAQEWVTAHEYGIESPYRADGIGSEEDHCTVVE